MTTEFAYKPHEHEREKASNSYLMSLVAIIVGLPLPIINVIATLFYAISQRNSTYFVRWHSIQALVSQVALMPFNSFLFWWTIKLFSGAQTPDNAYFAYLFTIILFNALEFFSTIYAAVQVRKGLQVEFWFFGGFTHLLCRR